MEEPHVRHKQPKPKRPAGPWFQCTQCPIKSPSLPALSAHRKKHHPVNPEAFSPAGQDTGGLPFVCNICGKGYHTSMGLLYHMHAHEGRTYPCPVCSSRLSQKSSIRTHLKKVHEVAQCVTCSGIFKLGQEYNQHVLHSSSLSRNQAPDSERARLYSSSARAGNHTCPHCSIVMPAVLLSKHIAEIHGAEKPFQCRLCGKGFLSISGLNHHKLHHTGQKFMCPICDTTFTQKGKVKRHLKNIHGCLPCSTCQGLFRIGPEFEQHVLYCPNDSKSGQISG